MNEDEELLSNCCGTLAGEYEDIGICPSCKEHCEFVTGLLELEDVDTVDRSFYDEC